VNNQCLAEYEAIKLKKKYQFVIYKLNVTNTEIVVGETGAAGSDYEDFINKLPATEPRWAVFDLGYITPERQQRNKLVFVSWSPDDAKIKSKMLYASSKDALRRSLVGIAVEVQATDYDEIAYESIVSKAERL